MNESQKSTDAIYASIKKLCELKDVSIKKMERDIGLSNGYVKKVGEGQVPSIDKLNAIANYFKVSRDFLLGEPSPSGTGINIRLLGKVAAGLPIEAAENMIGEEEIPQRLATTGDFFALLIKGDSMSPDIQDGDKIIVRQQPEVECGQIAVVLINGNDAVCKEYKRLEDGIMLISRNPNYAPMVFTDKEVNDKPVRIIGRVIEVRREL